MTSAPVASVAIAGSGLTAWCAAAALRRRIPTLDVRLVHTPAAPNALADRMIGTLPSIRDFHSDLSLSDEDTIVRAASGLRLGTLFSNWVEKLPDYVHAYGAYGTALEGVAFHQLWLRERRRSGLPQFDHFSPSAEMARAGAVPKDLANNVRTGLQLTLPRYCKMMRAFALHLGVSEIPEPLREVELCPRSTRIEGLRLEGGGRITADLFLDCTGPDALLRSRLKPDFQHWSSWLLCDRMVIGEGPPAAQVHSLDRTTALASGWQSLGSSPERSLAVVAYSSAHMREGEADVELAGAGFATAQEKIALRQGRWGDLWVGNCAAIGDAAVSIEPLECTNLHLAHSQIDRVVRMMPGSDCAPIELVEFNRQCALEADRVRDFICLHYVCSRRMEPFWNDARSIPPPDSLAHTLSLFSERGRLPYYEEETFARDSWLAVLLGQGLEPREIDPLADLVPPAEAARAFARMSRSLSAFTLPAGSPLPELNPHGIR